MHHIHSIAREQYYAARQAARKKLDAAHDQARSERYKAVTAAYDDKIVAAALQAYMDACAVAQETYDRACATREVTPSDKARRTRAFRRAHKTYLSARQAGLLDEAALSAAREAYETTVKASVREYENAVFAAAQRLAWEPDPDCEGLERKWTPARPNPSGQYWRDRTPGWARRCSVSHAHELEAVQWEGGCNCDRFYCKCPPRTPSRWKCRECRRRRELVSGPTEQRKSC